VRIRGLVVVLALVLAACSGGSGGSDDASRATTTSTPPPTVPGASDQCAGFRGATTQINSIGPTAPGFLTDATAGAQGCLDVVTFTFQTRGDGTPPGYSIGYRNVEIDPFTDGDPPSPIDVPGNAFLEVTIWPALSSDPSVDGNPPTYLGNLSLQYGDHHHLEIVRELPDGKTADGQDTVHWVIGLDATRPFRVDRAANPPRVMILIG
jgi:hypothetical protein